MLVHSLYFYMEEVPSLKRRKYSSLMFSSIHPAFGSYYEKVYCLLSPVCRRYGSVFPNELCDLINRFKHCIAEIKTWMKVN